MPCAPEGRLDWPCLVKVIGEYLVRVRVGVRVSVRVRARARVRVRARLIVLDGLWRSVTNGEIAG